MIFPAKCFHSLHAVANDALAPLAFRGPKPDMARLAIRVSFVHRETDIVVLKFAIAFEGDATCALSILAIDARSQKWVAAFGAEEMVFVVCTFAKLRVVQSDKSLIHNGRLTMVAPRREALVTPPLRLAFSGRQQIKDTTHLVVIEMAVGFTITLVRAHIFKEGITVRTSEAAWVPSDTHRTDDTSDNRSATAPARKAAAATRGRCWREYSPTTCGWRRCIVHESGVVASLIDRGRIAIIRI